MYPNPLSTDTNLSRGNRSHSPLVTMAAIESALRHACPRLVPLGRHPRVEVGEQRASWRWRRPSVLDENPTWKLTDSSRSWAAA